MNRNSHSVIIAISVSLALIAALLLDTWQVFRITSKQTLDSGQYHLDSISNELERMVNNASQQAMKVGLSAWPLLDDREALETFIDGQKEALIKQQKGFFNLYIAGTGWVYVPDFEIPDDFVATERDWYKGAKRSQGEPYVTAPYVDTVTGDICYTVSVMLGDNDTVVGLDYSMETIQSHIVEMYESGSELALIVTGEGIIAGCSDETLVGRKLIEGLPEYSSIFALAKAKQSIVMLRVKSDLGYENLFAAAPGFGWYLIVSESDWNLYRDSYLQMIGTTVIALLLLLAFIVFIVITIRRQQATRSLIREKNRLLENMAGQITAPLRNLLDAGEMDNGTERAGEMVRVRTAARQILEALKDTDEAMEKTGHADALSRRKNRELHMNAHFRNRILLIFIVVIAVSLVSNLWVSFRWGDEKIRSEVSNYDYMLTEWVGSQKGILDMFCSVISTNPQMLDDYEGTVSYLDRITRQYPEISASYMGSPNLSPAVFINSGWVPPEGWNVDERPWYVETMDSESGFSISAPYYDDQTGLYCVTMAERVYDASTGEFLGIFGIDFFMDQLISLLGGSYSDTGYAFLVDSDGVIINHPHAGYQMTVDNAVNISELNYGQLKADGHSTMTIRDYDGTPRVLIACRNEASHFVIYEAVSFFSLYAPLIFSESLILFLLLACAFMVYRLLSDLIKWQDSINEQMRDAADTAIAAGRAKSRFLAQMSHEIRTPINAVLGMNEMILRESKDEAILDYASGIQTSGRTLLYLINSILDFSKIEEGKMEIIPVEYDTSSFINNLVVSISERAKGKDLLLKVDVDESLPSRMYGDDVRLSQVIMNLLTNAVKYTEKGQVHFSIAKGAEKDGSIELKVSVQDTGIGIREEDLPKLFESFERLDEVRNRNIEGTGLGMVIVTRLLDMMGSRLNVESVYGKGSAFSFTVLQKIVDGKPIGDYSQRLEVSHGNGNVTLFAGDASILAVDDNEMNLKVVKNLLKLFGIKPDLVNSGFEAIESVRHKQYHIILLDHMMPEMDGIETLSEMKKEKLLDDHTAVIALTANAVIGAKEHYLAAGFDAYLSKPIEVGRLEELLLRFLPPGICHIREADSVDGPGAAAAGAPADAGLRGGPAGAPTDAGFHAGPAGAPAVAVLHAVPADAAPGSADAFLEAMQALGYDIETGLRYAAADRSFYLELVRMFADGSEDGILAIRKDYEEHDIRDYQIRVHALKSTARQIGAKKLSDLALSQENAAKEGDLEAIRDGVDELLGAYEAAGRELKAVADASQASSPAAPDEVQDDLEVSGTAHCIDAGEAESILREAAAAIDDFEEERAARLLKPLMEVSARGIPLHEPVREILDALDDFDPGTAAGTIKTLLERMADQD